MISIKIEVDERLARKVRPVAKAATKPRVRAIAALCALAIPMTLMAAPVTIPNDFSANTPASAADVNANFAALAVGINDNDSRISDIVATNPTPSQAGVSAYVTTLDNAATIGTSFNSSGGAVSTAGGNGDYRATFSGITCVDGNGPVGIATAIPYIGGTAATCRIGSFTQTGADCVIAIRCFSGSGTLRAGAVAIDYRQ